MNTDLENPIEDMLDILTNSGAVVDIVDGNNATCDYLFKHGDFYEVYNTTFTAREVNEISLCKGGWVIHLREQE